MVTVGAFILKRAFFAFASSLTSLPRAKEGVSTLLERSPVVAVVTVDEAYGSSNFTVCGSSYICYDRSASTMIKA